MIPKILTQAEWKPFAARFKLKDNGLQQALASFEKLAEDKLAERSTALAKVIELATSLKKSKEVTAQAPAVKHLADLLRVAEAERKKLEAALVARRVADSAKAVGEAQKAGAPQPARADAGDGADYRATLLAAYQKLKSAGDLTFELLICEGKPHLAVMIAPKITAAHKELLTRLTGGSKRFLPPGHCRFLEGKLWFYLEKPPSGLARRLQDSLLHFTGKKLPVAAGKETVMGAAEIALTEKQGDERFRQAQQIADGVVSRARVNRLNYKMMLLDASTDFKGYADPKIARLEEQIKASDLFQPLVKFALSTVTAGISDKIGDGLEGMYKAFVDQLKDEISDALKSALLGAIFKDSEDIEALKQGVKSLVAAARKASDAMSDVVVERIEKPMQEIARLASQRKPWSDEQSRRLQLFVDRDLEATLVKLGVPTGATASALQDRLYEGFVYQFEEQWLIAQLRHEGRRYDPSDSVSRAALKEAAAYNTKQEMGRRQQERQAEK